MLSAGARLGPYEVVSPLGAGGMGEVYRARDTKLDRDVALKVLPEAFTADPDRLARFQREAKVLASLNHPHIGQIYGLEEAEGQKALALELVEGPTLADRIARGPIPLDEALPIARQIAEALEAAHEQGIIHRDLKPANVKVKADGTVKVLDFGLAKAYEPNAEASDDSQSPTLSARATQAGVILGTAAYMAPEQARGKPVDKRADIWAFGAVLYEMLTGKRAFVGSDVTDTLASVLRSEPDWSALPPTTSRRVRELVRKCLRKSASRRVQHIGDARVELEDALAEEEAEVHLPPPQGRFGLLAAGLAVGLLVGAAGMWGLVQRSAKPDLPEVGLVQLTANPAEHTVVSAALSPDGRYLAFADLNGVRVQVTATGETHEVPLPEELRVDEVDWFPDGATLLLGSSSSELWKASMFGGVPRKLAERAFGAAISADGRRVAYLSAADSPSRQVYVMGADGEEPRPLAEGVGGESFWELAWSPDGEWLLVGTWKMVGAEKRTSIQAVDIETQERHLVLSDPRLWQDWRAVLPFIWTEAGRLVYGRQEPPPANLSSNLWSINIDAGAVARGEPDRLTQLPAVNFRDLSQAAGGRIAFLAERNQSDVFVADLAGLVDDARRVTFDERDDYPAAYLPDGRTLVLLSHRGGAARAFRLDLESGDSLSLSSQADRIGRAEASWDGANLLHRESEQWFSTPIEGGPGQLILGSGDQIHCSHAAERCVLGERNEGLGEYVFSDLDPLHGKGPERARIKDNPPFTNWDVSADGEHVAVVHNDGRIRLVNLTTGGERVIEDDAWFFGEFISFAADGGAVFVDGSRSGRSARTRKSLLRVSLESEIVVEELRFRQNVWHVQPKAAPDGRHLAFGAMTFTANAWMITDVP